MAAFSSISDLINKMSGGSNGSQQMIPFFREHYFIDSVSSRDSEVWVSAGITSLWRAFGSPRYGIAPTTVEAPTSATQGALPLVNAGGARELWLVRMSAIVEDSNYGDSVHLFDRLLHIGGLDGTVTSAQTVGGTLTRNTGGAGNGIFIEVYDSVGVTATTLTVDYTNQDGVTGRTGTVRQFGDSDFAGGYGGETNVMIPVILQAGDTGVQAVADVTLAATTGTAGDFGVTIAKRLTKMNLRGDSAAGCVDLTTAVGGPALIENDACLNLVVYAEGGTAASVYGMISVVES